MKLIHGAELFNYVASFRDIRNGVTALGAQDILPVPERAAHLRNVANKHFGIDRQKLIDATDEQVICSLGYTEVKRTESRYLAQQGMGFAVAAMTSPLYSSSILPILVLAGLGLYKFFAAYEKGQTARSCAMRGATFLQDKPSRNKSGQLQLWT